MHLALQINNFILEIIALVCLSYFIGVLQVF